MNKCTNKFLWFSNHEWEPTGIQEDRKTTGKVPDTWEEGIYKVNIVTTETFKCKYCGETRTEQAKKTEVHRQFYR